MFYTVYLLEDEQKKWYIGYSSNLKLRIEQHQTKHVISTKNRKNLRVIYSECYLHKQDAKGRERFLKSGAGHRFLKKQLRQYLSSNH